MQIVIGGKPPNPFLKSYFINQFSIKYMVGDFADLPRLFVTIWATKPRYLL